jgi:aspartate ammonia-lyase
MLSGANTRIEHDLLGNVKVPESALYGAQTQRAIQNFDLQAQRTIGQFPRLVQGLILTKHAAAMVNLKIGLLDDSVGHAILDAAHEVLSREHYDQFPIHHLHGGGGTSANMNANEVLANLAEEMLGGKRGEYHLVHPNDHVNLNQSTNDVYPTACHIAVILKWPALNKALRSLADTIAAKAREFQSQQRIARTCLQDAVAISFANFFGGHAKFVRRSAECVGKAVDELHEVPLGGTIVGRADDVPPAYFKAVIPALCKVTGDSAYSRSKDLFDAAQNLDDLVRVSGELDLLARGIIKICRDLRLMGSGPEAGLGELILPAVQPGSSIMPGKINPVIPEFAIQLSFKVMGNHTACQAALDHGELDLNVWESVAVFGVLESMEFLQSAAQTLADKCVSGLAIDAERNSSNAQTIIPIVTEFVKRHGYSSVNEICRKAKGDTNLLRRLLKKAFPKEDHD